MISRLRSVSILVGALALAGCAEAPAPLRYARNTRLADELKVKPKLREAVYATVDRLFGDSPRDLKVPPGSGLPAGGVRLASHFIDGNAKDGQVHRAAYIDADGNKVLRAGGFALYRRHCQHCHGSSGDGNGPTADFLYPRPRDYRRGLYKFTSTVSNQKPTRADLRKTIYQGLHGTSMPAFEALMSPLEVEQVIDYMTFLSMRGEFEERLLKEAAGADESDPEALSADVVQGHLDYVFASWKDAEKNVVDTAVARVEPTHASVVRGRDLFWKNDCLGCHGPKAQGNGQSFIDEKIFQEVVFHHPSRLERFDEAEVLGLILAREKARKDSGATPDPLPREIKSVAGQAPWVKVADVIKRLESEGVVRREGGEAARPAASPGEAAKPGAEQEAEPEDEVAARTAAYAVLMKPERVERLRKEREAWLGSLDDWGNPLRPANLQRGIYKGGRRPLDLYWRISKGINGAKMPAHDQSLKPEQIWDLVNFVLALPYEPELVEGTPPPPPTETPPAAPTKVAGR